MCFGLIMECCLAVLRKFNGCALLMVTYRAAGKKKPVLREIIFCNIHRPGRARIPRIGHIAMIHPHIAPSTGKGGGIRGSVVVVCNFTQSQLEEGRHRLDHGVYLGSLIFLFFSGFIFFDGTFLWSDRHGTSHGTLTGAKPYAWHQQHKFPQSRLTSYTI